MFDKYLINEKSLQNVYDQFGNAVGFKIAVRNSNYRGTFASLVNGYYIVVDGQQYLRKTQRFEVNGKPPRTMDDMKNAGYEHWNFGDEAWLYIEKEDGLESGEHVVLFKQSVFAAYGYFPNCEDYIKEIEPGPETKNYLIMDKTFYPVEYRLTLNK